MKTLAAILTMATAFAEPVPMTFTATDGTEVLYRFAAPEKTEEGKQYPLVLFLHGSGSRGTDNKGQLKNGVSEILDTAGQLVELVYLIAPQCPLGRRDLLARSPQTWAAAIPICVGHDSWTRTYKDREVMKWLFAQRNPD
jgi:predicted peptidase